MNQIEKSLNHFFQRLGHTPGPWEFCNSEYSSELIASADKGKGEDSILYHGADWPITIPNARLIIQSPAMLRTLCRTYLWMLVNVKYRGTLTVDQTLADLRNEISEATGITCQEVQDTFEQYCLWIQLGGDIPPKTERQELADQRDPETKVFSAMQEGSEDWDDRP